MITEFTCGIYQVKMIANVWSLRVNNHPLGTIPHNGSTIQFSEPILFAEYDLIEIAVLMNNIKRQYKQLQTP